MELAQHIPSEGLKICAEGSLTGKLGHIDYALCPAMLDTAAEVRSSTKEMFREGSGACEGPSTTMAVRFLRHGTSTRRASHCWPHGSWLTV
jgi:hypothetical protein